MESHLDGTQSITPTDEIGHKFGMVSGRRVSGMCEVLSTTPILLHVHYKPIGPSTT